MARKEERMLGREMALQNTSACCSRQCNTRYLNLRKKRGLIATEGRKQGTSIGCHERVRTRSGHCEFRTSQGK